MGLQLKNYRYVQEDLVRNELIRQMQPELREK